MSILVEGVLALEVKLNPNKAERDRAVGQMLNYNRRWVTWCLMFEAEPSCSQRMEDLLCDKQLDHILVIDLGPWADEEDEEGYEDFEEDD